MVSVTWYRGRLAVSFPYSEEAVIQVKTINGYAWNAKKKFWTFPATYRSARKIIEVFTSLRYPSLELPDKRIRYLFVGEPSVKFQVQDIPLYKSPPPWEHQKKAFWFAVEKFGGLASDRVGGGALLALGMGAGKSRITIDLISNYQFKRTLIICPAKVVAVWPYQIEKHAAIPFQVVPLYPKRETTAKRAKKLLGAAKRQLPNTPLVVITNYEGTRRHHLKNAIKAIEWDALILDECHRIKAPRGTDSEFFWKLGQTIPHRLGLTGTPMPNDPSDIFAQGRFLDASLWGSAFSRFRNRYCIMGGFVDKQIVGWRSEKDLSREMSEFALQIRTEDVLDLPDAQYIYHPVILDRATQSQYDSMERDFVVWVKNDEGITAANGMVKVHKLQEITGGFIRNPDTKEVTRLGHEKEEALRERLADLPADEPVVVFTVFEPDMTAAKRAAISCWGNTAAKTTGREVFELSGKKDELAKWQNAKGGEVLVAQIDSGKEGVDMTRAKYAIYYSLNTVPGTYDQSQRRLLRPGQTRDTVVYIHLVAQGTIDKKIYRALERKENVIETILKEVRENAENGEKEFQDGALADKQSD